MTKQNQYLAWMDMEFSGLNPEKDVILEIATIITDSSLNIIAEGPVLAIHHPESILEGMDNWNREHHGASGLLERVRSSQESHASAEGKIYQFMAEYCKPRAVPLCGNSIYQDRKYLEKYMPRLHDLFHYRNIDVSSIKELAKRWYPSLPELAKKKNHLALDDIRESIEELKYYRERIFKSPAELAG